MVHCKSIGNWINSSNLVPINTGIAVCIKYITPKTNQIEIACEYKTKIVGKM